MRTMKKEGRYCDVCEIYLKGTLDDYVLTVGGRLASADEYSDPEWYTLTIDNRGGKDSIRLRPHLAKRDRHAVLRAVASLRFPPEEIRRWNELLDEAPVPAPRKKKRG